MKKRCLTAIGLTVVGALAGILVISEYVYFFPLTPLFLDLRGETRLPEARGKIRLLFAGDTLLADSAQQVLTERGYDYPFAATRSLISGADLAIGNLEGPLAATGKPRRDRRWAYQARPEAAIALKRAGFDLMDLANNHIQDCGDAGIKESIEYLDRAGIGWFGGGLNAGQAHRPAIAKVRGVSIAFLGYIAPNALVDGRKVSMRNLAAGAGRGGAAWGAIELIRHDVSLIRQKANLVIVSLHLGDRYQQKPEDFERTLCHQIIEAGADAVIGHGAHVLGPLEIYRGKPILYSVGNFAFGSRNIYARFSLMAFLDIGPANRLSNLYALPIYTNNINPWVAFQPKVLMGMKARGVLSDLVHLSDLSGVRAAVESNPERLSLQF